jgi:hypothetical protein
MTARAPSQSVKQARKAVTDKIRNDWEFNPQSKSAWQAEAIQDECQSSRAVQDNLKDIAVSLTQISEWRERTFAESDASSEEEARKDRRKIASDAEIEDKHASSRDPLSRPDQTEEQSQHHTERKRQGRRRRRRKRLEEELEWNNGLRFWEARRDAWSSARQILADYGGSDTSDEEEQDSAPVETHPRRSITAHPGSSQVVILVPVAPPLFPDTDPTRSNISPAIYPSIYDKVVKQGLVPTVPINLSHMIPALVQGWQDDGEWPPKPGAVEPSMANKRDMIKMIAGNEAMKARGRAYGAPEKEGDILKRGVRGSVGSFLGTMSGIIGVGSNSGSRSSPKKEQQSPSMPGSHDSKPKGLLGRHLRHRSSMSASTISAGNVSDNDVSGGHGLVQEEPDSPSRMRKFNKVGKVFKGLGKSSPAPEK